MASYDENLFQTANFTGTPTLHHGLAVDDAVSAASSGDYLVYSDMGTGAVISGMLVATSTHRVDARAEVIAQSVMTVMYTDLLTSIANCEAPDITLSIAAALASALDATGAVESHQAATAFVADIIAAATVVENASVADAVDTAQITGLAIAYANALQDEIAAASSESSAGFMVAIGANVESVATMIDGLSMYAVMREALSTGAVVMTYLKVGDEKFVGWATNTATGALSEYSTLPINSMAEHEGDYYAAGEAGIYRMAGVRDAGEAFPAYIKTGAYDFSSDAMKRVSKAYMVFTANHGVKVKVITVDHGKTTETWYRLASYAKDSPDTVKLGIGQGLRSRYWQFEIVTEDDAFEFVEIGVLPVSLSRRV